MISKRGGRRARLLSVAGPQLLTFTQPTSSAQVPQYMRLEACSMLVPPGRAGEVGPNVCALTIRGRFVEFFKCMHGR